MAASPAGQMRRAVRSWRHTDPVEVSADPADIESVTVRYLMYVLLPAWRGGGDQLLVYRSGPRWHDVTAADINDYLREVSGGDYTGKDFRTWHATVLAAVGLAVSEGASGSDAARKRAIARVVREVAGYLGNTPAVARASYIDPRVIEFYENGHSIASVLGDLGKNCDFGDLATSGRRERGGAAAICSLQAP
jgi:DNA topoisomerase I-like protein